MLTALYYPHTDVTNPVILKNALLLWDNLETIVPRHTWAPKRLDGDRFLNEAVDLLVRPRVPTQTQRQEAHRALSSMARTGALSSLLSAAPGEWGAQEVPVHMQKFLGQTWRVLEHDGLAHRAAVARRYRVPAALGFLMMTLLADSCAGTQVQKVTDRVDAYNWLSQNHARALGSPYVTGLDASQFTSSYDRLVTLSLEVLDGRAIPLRKLVEFRKREAKQGGADYSAMRRRYLKTLQAHLKRVGTEVRSRADVLELERQFKEELRQDLADLKRELKAASLKVFFSKDVWLTALVTVGALAGAVPGLPIHAGAVGIIPLLGAAADLRGARRTALQRHVTSCVYQAGLGGIQLY